MTTVLRNMARAIVHPTRRVLRRLGISNDQLIAAQEAKLAMMSMRLDRMLEAHNNQSTAMNTRLDRLERVQEAQTTSAADSGSDNRRLMKPRQMPPDETFAPNDCMKSQCQAAVR